MSRLIRMSVIASGSTGNATYVESEKGSLLVDVGLTGKKMEELFSQIDRNIKDLNGILVTHEHIDHIKVLGLRENTWKASFMDRNLSLIHMKRNLQDLYHLTCHMTRIHSTSSTITMIHTQVTFQIV